MRRIPMNERDIFLAAMEIKNVDERLRFIDERLGIDDAAKKRILDLLAAASAVGDFLEEPGIGRTAAYKESQPSAAAGLTIGGKYTFIELVGEGGMGQVWVADQKEPVQRRVAVKLIK